MDPAGAADGTPHSLLRRDAFWRQVVLGTGTLFVLGALLYLVQHGTHRYLSRLIGFRGIAWTTGWLGTPVHEFSHALVGKLFGLTITEVKPFAPDKLIQALRMVTG